jgi:hypothetical protein
VPEGQRPSRSLHEMGLASSDRFSGLGGTECEVMSEEKLRLVLKGGPRDTRSLSMVTDNPCFTSVLLSYSHVCVILSYKGHRSSCA